MFGLNIRLIHYNSTHSDIHSINLLSELSDHEQSVQRYLRIYILLQLCRHVESKGECHLGSVGVSNEVVGVSVCSVWSVRRT